MKKQRILITGYTTRMFGSTQIRGDYITFSYLLEDALREMGHVVERRKVAVGEELVGKYSYAFCGVAPLSSLTSGQVPETHYVMETLKSRHAVYADDWSFCSYGDSVRYALERWDRYLSYKKFRHNPDLLEATRESLEGMIRAPFAGNNAPVVAPMFPWGDHEFLMRGNYNAGLVAVDPSPWLKFPSISITPDVNRRKVWLMAALSDHSRWVKKQGFRFPVEYIGNKKLGVTLNETQTVKQFADVFGVLATGYPSAGSGWWRTRYLNAAWAESIIYSDPKDAAVMGEAFRGTPRDFELLHEMPVSYRKIQNEQTDWLNKNVSQKEEVMETLEKLLQ